jgi:hypothetical protein
MTHRRHIHVRLLAIIACLFVIPALYGASQIPERISDDDFWLMVSNFSEPNGSFHSDNFVSNEVLFQRVIPRLKEHGAGGAYIGVGPEQNFTYLAATRPQIAFIIDIRRQAMLQHLMYKAIIELSADRADFLSMLFSRHRPAGLTADSTAVELFNAYEKALPDHALFEQNLASIFKQLTVHHGFALTGPDRHDIEYVYSAFFGYGPELTYTSEPALPTYTQLMVASDRDGENQSYLGSEANFHFVQQLQNNNLVIPIVGDFAGTKAMRAIAGYLKDHDAVVNSFYTSNVEQYLFLQGDWDKFYVNVAQLPVSPDSVFIRWIPKGTRFASPLKRNSNALCPISQFIEAFQAGNIQTYRDVLTMTN